MSIDKNAVTRYIEEQRRFHDELTDSFKSLRGKITTYIGLILAFLAFLYAGALDDSKPTQERLFIPEELYGKIFYAAGLFLLLYALGKLIYGARPNSVWTVAFQSNDCDAIEEMTESEYLIKQKNDYENARKDNILVHAKKHEAVKDSFYPLLLGAILLIVLRYFQ